MTVTLRPALPEDCAVLTGIATRSKAHWGYDAAFMEACRDELAVTAAHLGDDMIVAECLGQAVGFARVGVVEGGADLDAMFVDPGRIGQGIGRILFDWCVARARAKGYRTLLIDADPNAEAFYAKLGAHRIGASPSASIPGRVLPQLALDL